MPNEKKTVINIESLSRAAQDYDPVLRKLPFLILMETLKSLRVNMIEADAKDTVVAFHRKGGLAKPYVVGGTNTVAEDEIGKIVERHLEPKPSFVALKDHIQNYKAKRILSNSTEKPDMKTKKHPQELLILESKIRTVGEDILDALFHAERDETDKTPMGMFDGFNTILDNDITAGRVSAPNGNLITTGAITRPEDEDDMEALDKIVEFLRKAHPQLRKRGILYITNGALFAVQDALGNKMKYKNAMEYDVFLNHLRSICQAPGLQIVSDPALGSGSRLMLINPGLLDFGVSAKEDTNFVEVRAPYEDPNIVQFWMQWQAGCRITSVHAKDFVCNEQTNTATNMSGDYS
jgi:hypothetical protein